MNTIQKLVARVGDLQDGQMKQVTVGNIDVLLVRTEGQFYALGATCPHYGASLAEGTLCHGRITCPWHASIFDATTGDLLEPPSLDALPRFPLRVDGDEVYVTVPEKAEDRRVMPMCDCNPQADRRLFAIIGSGAAGSAAAEVLRQRGFQGRIVMIGAEPELPYDRPGCSKDYLAGEITDELMPLRGESFYKQHGIERLQRRVVRLEVPTRQLFFDNTESLSADAVLVATGGVAKTLNAPGSDLPGVMTLRSWADSRAIRDAARQAERVVVVGAGFIGMEVAASLAGHHVPVTMVAPESVPLEKQLGWKMGAIIRLLHEENGTAFRLGRTVKQIVGEGKVQSVVLDDGSQLAADLVVIGLGITPATEFLRGVSVNDDRSLDVDGQMRLAQQVYAAGDVARYPDPFTDRRIRIEHWRLAQQQGRVAARAMLGDATSFQSVPFFWTRQFGVSLMYAGYAPEWDEVIVTGNARRKEFTAFYAKNNRLLAAAGTQDRQIAAFMERMRVHQLPTAAEIRDLKFIDLAKGLEAVPTLSTI